MGQETEKVKEQAALAEQQPTTHPLDEMFKVDESEITRLLEHPLADEAKSVEVERVEEKEAEAQPQPEKTEEAPETETPEPPKVEAKEEPKPEKRERLGPWKRLRELERELKEEKKRREELEAKLSEKPATYLEQEGEELALEDPITKVSKEVESAKLETKQTREELERLKALNAEMALINEIKAQEAEYLKTHPDYHDAVAFVAETEKKEYEAAGILDMGARELLEKNPEAVEQYMMNTGKEDEFEAAKELVFSSLLNARRRLFIDAVRRAGRDVAHAAYQLALARGYQPASQKKEAPKSAAKERVQRAKEQEALTTSISALKGPAAPPERKITSRQQLLEMEPDELERFIIEMDKKDPFWDRTLG